MTRKYYASGLFFGPWRTVDRGHCAPNTTSPSIMAKTETILRAGIFAGAEVARPRHDPSTTKYAGEGTMTASELPTSATSTVDVIVEDAERCSTCRHPAADHDTLSARYCAATMSGGLTRGCICK